MSSSSMPRIRNNLAKHLKKKINNGLKIQTSVSVRKDPVFIGEKSTKISGKRKVFSDEDFEKRVLRRKNGNEFLAKKNVKKGTIFSDDEEEENVGLRALGKRYIVPNSSNSSSSSDDESGYEVLGRRVVRNGSCSKNANFSRFKPNLVSNVVRDKSNKSVSSSSSSEDEGRFKFSGKRIVEKGSCSKNARVSRLRPRPSFVSNSSSSSDEDGTCVFLGENIVNNGSRSLKASCSRLRKPLVSKVVRAKKTKPVSARSSSEDDDSEDELGEKIARNVSFSKKASDFRWRTPLVSNEVIRGNNGPFHSVGVISTHGFVENMDGDSGKSVGRFDKKKDEIELSSDEGDKDDAEMENGEDKVDTDMESEEALFSSSDDDSLDVPYLPSDNDAPSDNDVVKEKMVRSRDKCKKVNLDNDGAVGLMKNKSDIRTGNEQNKENDVVVEKLIRSGKKCEEVDLKRNKNKRDAGTGAEENKGNRVIVEEPHRSGKKCKRENQEKDFSVKFVKHKRDIGIEVILDFDVSSDEEERYSKSQEKDPHVAKFEPPKCVMECRVLKDDESNSSKRECCEGERCSKAQKEDPQVGTFAFLNPIIECEAPEDNKANSSKQVCSNEKIYSCEAEVAKQLCKISARTRNDELIGILLNAVNEAQNVEENTLILEPLPLKFRFEDEVTKSAPEQTESDEEIDSLFQELNYCLRILGIDSNNLSKNENVDATFKVVDGSPAASCYRGVHDPVLDEQIGNVCRLCGIILLEIKDILPSWYMPRSKRQDMKYFDELPNHINDELQPKNSVNGPDVPLRVRGTVWDLIPGFEKDLFPHQCEGFEFLWKNIAGDIAIEKLPASLSGEGRGCIISHAPGTGKTRLAVVFLLSFLERYPNARPVILAPQPILSTWENEFVKWKVNVSFHNMNNPKLLGSENRFGGGTKRLGVRLAKLLSWYKGGGILGISYMLFGTLASKAEKGGGHAAIWEALVKVPGILVLDEGHVPCNDNDFIGNTIKKVKTKRCIMLSGTPFQNNFEELKTTLGLVDPNFHKMDKSSWAKLTEGKDELEGFRSRLDPYVHYYMGSLLGKSLPGLKDTMIFLRPSELQKKLMDACEKVEAYLALTYSVSLISVHPSALMVYKKGKFVNSPDFSLFKDKLKEIKSNYDEGVKIKFVMNLIQLADALGERVLVFSRFTYPLMFIKKQLETHFSWKEGSEVLYLDGKVEEKHRQQSMSSLKNSSSKAKVLLASLKACSEEINLVRASRVILLTTCWNPSVERQVISRVYRLGQEKVVHVYRLITSGMEVRQYELQAQKDQISQLIFSPVDEKAGEQEKSSEILEKDNILEQIQNLESFKNTFEKIIYQPKESDFLENFRFKDL